jgi:quercetin dioxygenase-like cupin family protein
MIRARDLAAATVAVAATMTIVQFGGTASADSPLMKSVVFPWESVAPSPTDVGAVRRFFRAPSATLDELESHVTTLNPGQSPHPPHQHVNEELIILKEGTLEAFVEGTWTPVSTGSIIFFASNHPHTVRNVGTGPATYYVVNWASPGMLKKQADAR